MGMTVAEYEARVADQGGCCAICRRPSNKLHIDHDHSCCPGEASCGKCIRGLLCLQCNAAIGYLYDDPEAADRAAAYLRRSR